MWPTPSNNPYRSAAIDFPKYATEFPLFCGGTDRYSHPSIHWWERPADRHAFGDHRTRYSSHIPADFNHHEIRVRFDVLQVLRTEPRREIVAHFAEPRHAIGKYRFPI